MKNLEETAVFIIHQIKQFCFGFETMESTADEFVDGSPAKAFYLNALYNYIAAFYLLDAQDNPTGGAFYRVLSSFNLERLLLPIRNILDSPLGETSFGEVVRIFRNKAIIHSNYCDEDLDRIYRLVDMENPTIQAQFRNLMTQLYYETKRLAIRIAEATGRPLNDYFIVGVAPDPDSQALVDGHED